MKVGWMGQRYEYYGRWVEYSGDREVVVRSELIGWSNSKSRRSRLYREIARDPRWNRVFIIDLQAQSQARPPIEEEGFYGYMVEN